MHNFPMVFRRQYIETGGSRMKSNVNDIPAMGTAETLKLIVLYSSDPDFCLSFTMLFQDRYRIVTVSNLDMLNLVVEERSPDLVIADAVPNERVGSRFDAIKRLHPSLPIILFYVSRLENAALKEGFVNYVDAMFSKPIDLLQVTRRINELVSRN